MEDINQKDNAKEEIQEALSILLKEKRYEDIHVKDICEKAGINRSTFYDYFQGIDDLMNTVEEKLTEQLFSIFTSKSYYTQDDFIHYFRFVEANQNLYLAYIENHFEFKKTKISLVNHIQKGSSQKGMNQNLESIYHQIFFCGGILSITNRWIIRGKKETPEQMAEILENEWGSALFQTL